MTAYMIRDATADDLEALCALRPSRTLHEQYLRDAATESTRLLVYEEYERIVGFVELDLAPLGAWNAGLSRPRFNDLFVSRAARSRGVGSTLIAYMEMFVQARGFPRLCCTVDPINNPRALALYNRLGYVAMQDAPYTTHTTFYDDDGVFHEHVSWHLDLEHALQIAR